MEIFFFFMVVGLSCFAGLAATTRLGFGEGWSWLAYAGAAYLSLSAIAGVLA